MLNWKSIRIDLFKRMYFYMDPVDTWGTLRTPKNGHVIVSSFFSNIYPAVSISLSNKTKVFRVIPTKTELFFLHFSARKMCKTHLVVCNTA